MNAQMAEKIVRNNVNMSNCVIDKVSESNNYFIFGMAAIGSDGKAHTLITPPFAVHKATGNIVVFHPNQFTSELPSIRRIR